MKKEFREIILIFTVFFIPGFFIQNLAFLSLLSKIVLYIVLGFFQISIILFLIRIYNKNELKDFGLYIPDLKEFIYVFILTIIIFGFSIGLVKIVSILPVKINELLLKGHRWEIDEDIPAIFLFLFAFITGYKEEIFFRSFLLTKFFQKGISNTMASLLSAGLFAFCHIYEGFIGIVIAFFMAILFNYIFLKRKNIHILAISHGLYNFIVLLIK